MYLHFRVWCPKLSGRCIRSWAVCLGHRIWDHFKNTPRQKAFFNSRCPTNPSQSTIRFNHGSSTPNRPPMLMVPYAVGGSLQRSWKAGHKKPQAAQDWKSRTAVLTLNNSKLQTYFSRPFLTHSLRTMLLYGKRGRESGAIKWVQDATLP